MLKNFLYILWWHFQSLGLFLLTFTQAFILGLSVLWIGDRVTAVNVSLMSFNDWRKMRLDDLVDDGGGQIVFFAEDDDDWKETV